MYIVFVSLFNITINLDYTDNQFIPFYRYSRICQRNKYKAYNRVWDKAPKMLCV